MKKIQRLILILFSILIIRDIIGFILFYGYEPKADLEAYLIGGRIVLEGGNPYEHIELFIRNHPPGLFYLYALLIIVFTDSSIGMMLSANITAWLTGFLIKTVCDKIINIYKIKFVLDSNGNVFERTDKERNFIIPPVQSTQKYELISWVVMFLYLFDLSVWRQYVEASNDIYLSFLFFLGLYFFFDKKIYLSAIFLGIALLVKIVPVFIFPVLIIYFISNKKIKQMILFFGIISLIFLTGLLPYLIDNFEMTISGILLLFSRNSNYGYFFENIPVLHDFFYENDINLVFFDVSIWFFIQGMLYGLLLIIILKKKMYKNSINLISSIIIIYVSLAILTNNYGTRYFCWIAPIFYIVAYFTYNKKLIILFYFMGLFELVFHYMWDIFPPIMMIASYFFTLIIICELFKFKKS